MFKTLTVLYVEDEEQISNIIIDILGSLFKELLFAKNGEDGLALYKAHKDNLDLIITDINMPRMNGIEMCTAIREENTALPIIITTAHNDKDFLHKAIELGASKFVRKPMDMKVLIDGIKKSVEPIILKQKLEEERILREQDRIKNAKFAAMGQLAAGITHEINTPLTYVKANFEMIGLDLEELPASNEKENINQTIEKIEDGLNRIGNIISSMSEISQQTGTTLSESNIYASVITSTILSYNKIKHISDVYINGKLFTLDMDKNEFEFMAKVQLQRVEQVWVVIINNAIDELVKIDGYENRRLDITIESKDDSIIVIFKDNAGGIDQNVMPNIFEPFKGTKASSGMGIGLSIAKKIIDVQGSSTIEAYNEDNGAVFKVVLQN